MAYQRENETHQKEFENYSQTKREFSPRKENSYNNRPTPEELKKKEDAEKLEAKELLKSLTEGNYSIKAEEVIKNLKSGNQLPKANQIRNFLGWVNNLVPMLYYDGENLTPEIKERLQYIRLKIAYAYGKEEKVKSEVKSFVNQSQIMSLIEQIQTKKECKMFCKYFEALVTFHKYYSEK